MPANVQSMAYVGEVPWHGLGKSVRPDIRSHDMITAAGLNWSVEKRPARGAEPLPRRQNGEKTFSRYEIVRMPRLGTAETEVALGMVSRRYQPLQNVDAFAFFDPIVDQRIAAFETAGALGDGERVWAMAKLADMLRVVRGDDCDKYLLLSNAHHGQGSVIVKFTAVRVVCMNTLMLATNDGLHAFRIRHSKSMRQRLGDVQDLIHAVTLVYSQMGELFRKLASIQLTPKMCNEYLEALFPQTPAQKRNGTAPPKRIHVLELLETAEDLKMQKVKGTLWAAYNAVTRFEDYRAANDETANARLNRVWFGAGAELKLRALSEAIRVGGLN